jgi:succinate-semialdehyde dehydrogenase/glutarate-semialdehyde dehydrogenase
VGPAYGITPWNFPAGMVTRKAAPALAAGCTFILKPAEQSPLTALLLAELWEQAGGPGGTLQVLPALDPVPVSEVLLEDPRIRKLTFTGSTEVGRMLYAKAARTLKRVSLELGGNAPFLVFEDADIELAAKEVATSKFRNAGQTCICTNRILVDEAVRAPFTEAFADIAAALKVGDPLAEDTKIGPLVDAQGLAKVKTFVEDAVGKGAKIVVGGKGLGGLFFSPTVLSGVRPGMRVLEEETFGPVAPIAPFRDEAAAIALANATSYGLAAYLWTRDLSRAMRVAEALEYGIVGINDGLPTAMAPQAPFGGMKDSGIGREGGRWGLEEYLEVKLVSIGLT